MALCCVVMVRTSANKLWRIGDGGDDAPRSYGLMVLLLAPAMLAAVLLLVTFAFGGSTPVLDPEAADGVSSRHPPVGAVQADS